MILVLIAGISLSLAAGGAASARPAAPASGAAQPVSRAVDAAAARSAAARPAIPKDAQTVYVSASAQAGGDGSRAAPFSTLQEAQAWSAPGDTIGVLPSPASVPPLGGGITLKPGQTLIGEGPSVTTLTASSAAPRITNKTGFANDGNGIVLADYSAVKNIMVTGTYRAGIYGPDVTGADVTGDNVSGQNTSCDVGIWIFPFLTHDSFGSTGIPNGWAGIMIDNTSRTTFNQISGNYVHDATCGDGIDVRLAGTATADVSITGNTVSDLKQGTAQGLDSVLAIGMQTGDDSRLTAEVDHNTQTSIGSPGADSEGVFGNIGGSSKADIDVDNDTASDITGGDSANGLEIPLMQQASQADVTVENSTFTNVQGDILEGFTFGVSERLAMTFDHVTASKASLASGADTFSLNDDSAFYNQASCLLIENTSPEFLNGGANSISTQVDNSSLTGCATGIADTVWRSQRASVLGVYNSTITGNREANVYIKNADPITAAQAEANSALGSPTDGRLGTLDVKVSGSNLSGAANGPDVYAYARPGTVASAVINLGTLQAGGEDNLAGGKPAAELSGVSVSAESDWWGQANGPGPTAVILADGTSIADGTVLTSPPR
jgi:hypothetical protein